MGDRSPTGQSLKAGVPGGDSRPGQGPRGGSREAAAGACLHLGRELGSGRETTQGAAATARCPDSDVRAAGGRGFEQERDVSELPLEGGLTLFPCVA